MGIIEMTGAVCRLVMAVLIILGPSAYAQQIKSVNDIKINLDGSQTLLNHVPQEVTLGLATKMASADSGQTLDLRIVLPSKDQAGLDAFIKELYNPKSPNYHHFLTPAQFALMYGASSTDSASVLQYLISQGLTVKSQSKNGFVLTVVGQVSTVDPAFKVNINNYKRTDGTTFFAPDVNPTIPPQIAGKISTIVGMDNVTKFYPHFHRKSQTNLHATAALSPVSRPNGAIISKALSPSFSAPGNTIAPSDIRTAYNLNSVTSTGSGQTLALYELDGYTPSDIATYKSTFSLPNVPLTNVFTGGSTGTVGDFTGEDVLDIDLAIAVAPGLSSILVYEAPNAGSGWIDQWDKIASDNLAKIISCSWGLYEDAFFFSYDHTVFSQLAAQGQSVFASSGDSGAYDNCAEGSLPPNCLDSNKHSITAIVSVDDPASDPYITGVGISILTANSNETYNSETASLQGGGGISDSWSIPTYQQGLTLAAGSNVSTTMRNVPDVVFTADPATTYYIFVSDPGQGTGWYDYWGSSAASPIWAAFMSRVNQGRLASGGVGSVIGFLNPVLYQIAKSGDYTTDFHDVTTGTNSLYPGKVGYDDATGLGSFNGLNLYNELLGPVAPTGLIPASSNGQIILNWTASSGAVSYNVKRATVNGGPYTTVSTSGAVTTNSYTDSSVSTGTTYYYVISAVNAGAVEGGNSSQTTILDQGLSAPTGVVAIAANAQVALTWTAVTGAVSYNVKRGTVSGGPYTTISTSGAVTTANYTDSSTVNGTTYYYVISAVNVGGESPNSSQVSATPLAPPSAPTGLSITPGNTQLSLVWSATATAASYNIKRAAVTGGPYTTISTSGAVTGPSYTDNGLTNATTYYYVISAVNVGGEGPNSAETSATPSASLAIAPTGLAAAPGNAQVVLTWTASATAISYNVKRAVASNGPYLTVSTSGAVTTTNYTDSAVTNGTSYYYVVSAVNGSGEGANSSQVSATPLAPPLAPTGLMATSGNTQAVLSWTASVNAASYNVKRATVTGGPYTTISTSGAVTTTNYTSTGLTNGVTYYYVVSGVDVGGEGSNSTEASVVPVPPVAPPTNLNATILGARVGSTIIHGGVVLTWVQSTDPGITQNKIYRSTGAGSYSLLTTINATTTYTDKNMPQGVIYNYKVTAFNGFDSLPSNPVTVNY